MRLTFNIELVKKTRKYRARNETRKYRARTETRKYSARSGTRKHRNYLGDYAEDIVPLAPPCSEVSVRREDDLLVHLQRLVGILERRSVLRDHREDELLVLLQRLV